MSELYKQAGVDIVAQDQFVERIKQKVARTLGPQVLSGVGGFGALWDMGDGRCLVSGADGVGTKLLLAQHYQKYDGLGYDLVGMNVNDVACSGARPLFFMDYLAVGRLNKKRDDELIESMASACFECKTALIGGETAEMPDLYKVDDFDLAGFCVGEVYRHEVIDGKNIRSGDILLGITSSGPHSNGFSLLRKLFATATDKSWHELALAPTRLYSNLVLACRGHLKGVAHITGGGLLNIPRMSSEVDYQINLDRYHELENPLFAEILKRLNSNYLEAFSVFNMGVGMVFCVEEANKSKVELLVRSLGFDSIELGRCQEGRGRVVLEGKNFAPLIFE
jgi:phosphoribosylformylglycinamidine cyclo-ligase